MHPKPVSAYVFGALNMVLALLHLFPMASDPQLPTRWADLPAAVLFIAIPGVLVVSGVGLFRLRPWGRVACVMFARCALVISPITIFVLVAIGCFIYLENANEYAIFAMLAIAAVIAITYIPYSVLILIFLTRPKVIAAFRPGNDASDGEEDPNGDIT